MTIRFPLVVSSQAVSYTHLDVYKRQLLTTAGATYPYGQDPHDANIRIAPSFPKLEELKQATELFVLCVKLISVEKLLEKA